jgi:hypothetical protein
MIPAVAVEGQSTPMRRAPFRSIRRHIRRNAAVAAAAVAAAAAGCTRTLVTQPGRMRLTAADTAAAVAAAAAAIGTAAAASSSLTAAAARLPKRRHTDCHRRHCRSSASDDRQARRPRPRMGPSHRPYPYLLVTEIFSDSHQEKKMRRGKWEKLKRKGRRTMIELHRSSLLVEIVFRFTPRKEKSQKRTKRERIRELHHPSYPCQPCLRVRPRQPFRPCRPTHRTRQGGANRARTRGRNRTWLRLHAAKNQ